MEKLYSLFRGSFSAIGVTAVISVVGLAGVSIWRAVLVSRANAEISTYVAAETPSTENVNPNDAAWQQEMILLGLATSSDPSAQSDIDPITLIGPQVVAQLVGQYVGLTESGTYTDEAGEKAAADIAGNVRASVSYKTYDVSSIKTDPDTSFDRMLAYRSDLRVALEPLLKNTKSELELYGTYIETGDAAALLELKNAAAQYRTAAESAAAMIVPRDAVLYHRAILNAMQEFAATVDAMVLHAADPFASVALLRTYNDAERDMFVTFNDLGNYYKQKTP